MKILLTDGTELEAILVTGGPRYVQGQQRDTLSFIFKAEGNSLEELDALFITENCKSIVIDDVNIHKDYTIRCELKKEAVELEDKTYEDRIFVAMSQMSAQELNVAALQETVDALVLEELLSSNPETVTEEV